ncbi:MAG: carboxypeptidase regulatory-like domain-containing protein, partial [bacterium]
MPRQFDRLCFSICLLLMVFGAWPCANLNAQLTRGFISGTIADPSGAVIVGAHVRITNGGTNEERDIATNPVGVYRFVALEPGTYSIEFSSAGFRTKRIENIRVGPAQEVVLNETLEVQAQSVSIEVRESPPGTELARATPTIARTFNANFLASIPLTAASRDVTHLALLAPLATRGPEFSVISAKGQRTRQNNFLIDGTDNNDLSVTVPSIRMIPEAVGEFDVQITPYSAEYGRNTGAQISVLTPRGSNTLHGEAWDYYRGNWMEPISLLNKQNKLKKTPRFVHNQAGGSLGGPVRKDRTFFFGLLEVNRRREASDARNAQAAVIPTPTGFAALATVPLGPGQTPQSRQAVLNALAFLPEVYKSVSAYQNPTMQAINGVPIEMGTIRIPLARTQNFWYGMGRLDHHLTENDTLTYRYVIDKTSQSNVTSNLQFGSRFAASAEALVQNHALSHTHILGSNLVNEFRFSYGRNNLAYPENDPNDPTIQILGAFTIGGKSNFPQGRVSNTFQWQDVTTYMFGRHSLKFGVDIHRNRLFNLATSDWKGTWTFLSLADFANNRAYSLRQTVTDASYDARQTNQYYFFQDDFKATRNLTFNLGLRYEYSGVPFGFFGAATSEIAAAGVPLREKPDRNNWAPRFGFAYSPSHLEGWKRWLFGDQQTVFRGGFGIAYDVLFYNILTITASNYPRVVRSQTFQPQTINLFPTLAPKDTTIPPFSPLTAFANTPADIQNPTTNFWSFSIQRQLSNNYLFEIGYSGNRSYHLLRQGERNPGTLTEAQAQTIMKGGTIPSIHNRRVNPAWGSRAT